MGAPSLLSPVNDMRWNPTAARRAAQFGVVLILSACGKSATVPEDPVATTISLSLTTVQMTFINQSVNLLASVKDQNGAAFSGTVSWSSSAPSVVSVTDAGGLRGLANGSAQITASIAGLSATASVTVEQVATLVGIVSGDDQEAVAGNALADPVVVAARDAGGTGVPGTEITFAPVTDHGSVTVTSATADVNGEASTVWTLGTFYGPQELVASIATASSTVSAIARADVPTPDIVVGSTITVLRSDPTSLETVEIRNTIRNDGDLTSGPFRVQVLHGATEVASTDVPDLAPGAELLLQLPAGPLTAGIQDLKVIVDADDDIVELNEVNNEAVKQLNVKLQTEIAVGGSASLTAATNGELLYRVEVPPGAVGALQVQLSGSTGDADLFIEKVTRPGQRTGYVDCVSAGPASLESCQFLEPEGQYHILVHAFAAFSGLTLSVELATSPLPFDLEIVFVTGSVGTPEQNAAVTSAAQRWMSLVAGDIPNLDFSAQPVAAETCIEGQPLVNDEVDDVRIFARIAFIDGPNQVLARAGPCIVRHQTYLPAIGMIEFDQADLERLALDGDMEAVVLHEMGHVLGIGTLWSVRGLLQAPSTNNPGADTHFQGPRALAAFDAAGGTLYTAGAKVPVENLAGPGSSDGHWRESVFDEELLTPSLDPGILNPLSAVTVESLADLGYDVDLTDVDAFTLDLVAPPLVAGQERAVIDLRGDIARRPITVVDEKGRIVEVLWMR